MNRGHLSNYFKGVGAKRLSAVEADPGTSNQHEFNGVAALKSIFGLSERRQVLTRFIYLGETEEDFLSETGRLTWYDAREVIRPVPNGVFTSLPRLYPRRCQRAIWLSSENARMAA